jgi:pyruvate/2-oxoglutarate dehydrogenase complex dihydrolipoamide acyltransferase (E2) component
VLIKFYTFEKSETIVETCFPNTIGSMNEYRIETFPRSRIATFDVCAVGIQKHQIAAMLEIDVTESRKFIKKLRNKNNPISFTAWLIKVISLTVEKHGHAAGYLKGKRKIVIFNDINVSIAVEKNINGQKVPIPLIIEKANERSIASITKQINDARDKELTDKDIVLHAKSNQFERIYYLLPGFVRRSFWRFFLMHPRLAFERMGNVAVTSIGMAGNVSGWFIPISVHPICFGISTIAKKPIVVDNKIEIREILNMTVLIDHDVIDGAPMARFISELSSNIEKGAGL